MTVQLDHTQCGFGKWYYGKGREDAEHMLPALKGPLAQIEKAHKELHESAGTIKTQISSGARKQAQAIYESETLSHLKTVQELLKTMTDLSKQHILSEDVDAEAGNGHAGERHRVQLRLPSLSAYCSAS